MLDLKNMKTDARNAAPVAMRHPAGGELQCPPGFVGNLADIPAASLVANGFRAEATRMVEARGESLDAFVSRVFPHGRFNRARVTSR